MGSGFQNPNVPENLKKQLALAVRSTHWSYAIFWSISPTQPGVLEWGNGYYNGDIKTRKTVQSIELNADQMGLQRSEHLRELYESLSAGESKRPTAALSPEDLTDTEWYYLVCMSFVFNIGQGLPGRTLANGQPIWVCNAHNADTKVFGRSLLAKSASIQTVVCFPCAGGVIELGITEPVSEDPSFIHHVHTVLKIPNSAVYSVKSNPVAFDPEPLDIKLIPDVECEDLEIVSPGNSSNGFEKHQPADDSLMVNGRNGAASQLQSWQLLDEDFSNCVHNSLNSSDCISQTFVDHGKLETGHKDEKLNDCRLQDGQDYTHTKQNSFDMQNEDLHYQSVLSALLKTSHPLILGPHFQNCMKGSSFVNWKKGGLFNCQNGNGTEQRLLKKILFEVPRMYARRLLESPMDIGVQDVVGKPGADEFAASKVLAMKRQREKINERFFILKSMIPSIKKVDTVSILDDTIEYVQELERRVRELESCRDLTELQVRTKRKPQDTVERISDNYGNEISPQKPSRNKGKASDIDRSDIGINYVASTENASDHIIVDVNDKDVTIELRCPRREGILLEIMDMAGNLHLDCHSVLSSDIDGILSVTIKSKYQGSSVPSSRMIRQALHRVAWRV